MGFVRKGSVPSLVAGVSVGALYALAGWRMQAGKPYSNEMALLASCVLAGASGPKAMRTGAPVSVGLSVLALAGLWVYGNAWRRGVIS